MAYAKAFPEVKKYKNLSMSLHAYVAHVMGSINPNARHLVVRPLSSMLNIFKASGLNYSVSSWYEQKTETPYVRFVYSHRWYGPTPTEVEQAIFGNAPFVLVEPNTNTCLRIGRNHWFCTSLFLGGAGQELFEAYPFITIEREELAKHCTTIH